MEFEDLRPTVLEINLENFRHNVRIIQDYIGSNNKIMPVIKANAYGTYINKNLEILNEFDIVAVAIVDEAIELRNLGYQKEIFVLNQPSIIDIENIGMWIKGTENYYLQNFVDSGNLIDSNVEGVSKEEMNEMLEAVKKYVPNADIRGL